MNTKQYIISLELSNSHNLEAFEDLSVYESTIESNNYLNYKGLNSFSEQISKQHKDDILNSMLLAQRAATKKFPEETQMKEWYTFYFEVLSRLGWVISNKGFDVYEEKSNKFELDKAIFTIAKDLLTGAQVKILMRSLEALKSLGDDDTRLTAFERDTLSGSKGNFMLGLGEENDGQVSLSGTGFILHNQKNKTKILFVKFEKDIIRLEFNYYQAILNEGVYADHRQLVIDKLGDADNFIASLDI